MKKVENKKSKKKNQKIKKVLIIVLVAVLILSGILAFYLYNEIKDKKEQEKIKMQQQQLLEKIKSSYNEYVKTNKEATLYEFKENEYKAIGAVSKGVELQLEKVEININTQYFKIVDLNYYIKYQDIEKLEKLTTKDERYKKYVIFNENIVTSSPTSFYKEDNVAFRIEKEFEFPIIIKEKDKYYVEYYGDLYYIKKENVVNKEKSENTKEEIRNNIRTLTYHTIYNTETEKCTNTVICHPIEQFDAHMKYLSENKYLTLTMEELEWFMDGKIQIPKKSIVITLDDGKYAINAVNIVEKYKVNATYFIITKRYDVSKIKTKYMDFQSHTHNLHNNWKCSGGNQGGQLLCEERSKVLEDLKTSQDKLGGSFAFAYPFFDFNNRAIELLKEAGFRLAFVGQYDTDGYSTKKTDKMLLRRKTIFSGDSLEKYVSYLK